jgi:hypothetical protein
MVFLRRWSISITVTVIMLLSAGIFGDLISIPDGNESGVPIASKHRVDNANYGSIPKAFADGLSIEYLPPTLLGGKQTSLYVKMDPPVIPQGTRPNVTVNFSFFEVSSNQTFQNTTYYISIHKLINGSEQPLLIDSFYSAAGPLSISIVPTDGFLEVNAEREPYSGAYITGESGGNITYKTPEIFDGGLYHIRIIIFAIGRPDAAFNEGDAPTFDSWLSIGTETSKVIRFNDETYDTVFISYYDVVKEITFDENKQIISWSIPFDWDLNKLANAQNIFVHQEIKLPKSMNALNIQSMPSASVNGHPLPGRSLALDPYSYADLMVVHVLLSKDQLLQIAQELNAAQTSGASASGRIESNAMNFDLALTGAGNSSKQTSDMISTDNGGILVSLSWSPAQLKSKEMSTLAINFYDAISGKHLNNDVKYDLLILDKTGNAISTMSELIAKNGTDTRTINFPDDGIYQEQIQVTGLSTNGGLDTSKNGIARGIVVVPEFEVILPFMAFVICVALFIGGRLKKISGRESP